VTGKTERLSTTTHEEIQMKALAALIAIVGFVFSGLATAAGLHVDGIVSVTDNGTSHYMYGHYNVRYNTTIAGAPYMQADAYANGLVYFYGRDLYGTYFSCYVPTSSPLYQGAVDIKNSLGNGSYLLVVRAVPSNECASVFSGQRSYALD
jgi:hypothetical protein